MSGRGRTTRTSAAAAASAADAAVDEQPAASLSPVVVRAAARSRGRSSMGSSGRRSLSSPPSLSREEVGEPDGVAAVRRIMEAKGRAPAGGSGAPPGQGEALPGVGLPLLSPGAGDLGEPELQAAPGAGAAGAPPRPDPRGASRRKLVDAGHRSPIALSGPGQPCPASPTASSETSSSDSEGEHGVVPGAPGGVPGAVQVPRTVPLDVTQVVPKNREATKTAEVDMADAADLVSGRKCAQAISAPRGRIPEDPPRGGEPPIGSEGFAVVKQGVRQGAVRRRRHRSVRWDVPRRVRRRRCRAIEL